VIAVAATTVLAMASGTGVSAPGSTPVAETSARVGEYEPNDAVTQATDLGLAGTTVNAAIETPNDVDLFEFYIVQTGSQAFFPITNTTPDARYTESIEAEIRDASGTVLTESGYGELAEGESDTVSYSFTPGRYYLAIESEYSDDDLVRSYTFSVNGSTVDAATMQSICDQSQAQVTVAAKKVRRAKKALRRADTPREIRKARARFKAAKKALRAAERRSVTYCVVL
jgi:hypothetical protein